jgi:hypothetical protein
VVVVSRVDPTFVGSVVAGTVDAAIVVGAAADADTGGASVAIDPDLPLEHPQSTHAVRQTIAARMIVHSITADDTHAIAGASARSA